MMTVNLVRRMTPPDPASTSWEQLLVQMVAELNPDVRNVSTQVVR